MDIDSKKPTDELWRATLELLEMPNSPGLFVLGSFAGKVTVYSQQLRALNLVDALAGMGYLHQGSQAAIVGAGFAGTTAAAALVNTGASVALFDIQNQPMRLQRNCQTRYIHPHIYDWPIRDIDEVDAQLPILNWNAQYAHELANTIQASWQKLLAKAGATKSEEKFGKNVTAILPENHRWRLEIDRQPDKQTFDIVIVSVGFGVEKDVRNSYSYWADIPLNDPATQNHKWLISGSGDGALTDVIRLCIPDDDHKTALEKIVAAIKKYDGGKFLEILKQRVQNRMAGAELFHGLDANAIAADLGLRKDAIILNATEDSIFGSNHQPPRASTLNRLATWVMWKAGKIELRGGIIRKENGVSGDRGDITVNFDDNSKLGCQEVLLRHGPQPVIDHLGLKLDRLKRSWERMYRSALPDPTLYRNWNADSFGPDRLSPDLKRQPALLLYSSQVVDQENEEIALRNSVNSVLRRGSIRNQLKEATEIDALESARVLNLRAESALRDPRSFGAALQAVCRAPIMIADITSIGPAMAFLLGIRAAVRRGVTISFQVGEMNPQTWEQMPFSFRELRVITVSNRTDSPFANSLATALEEALRRYARRPFEYQDLPGFGELRNLGSHEDDTSIRTAAEEVLLLCPFDDDYQKLCWPEIERALGYSFIGADTKDSPARRVIDLASPETINRRLFESIRRDDECVVDLTHEKANVFFELGFRLASHVRGARIIHCEDLNPNKGLTETAAKLQQLFGVNSYLVKTDSHESLRAALHLEASPWPGRSLSASYVFLVAQRNIFADQEGGGYEVLDFLWRTIESVGGKDRQRQANYPVLYIGNSRVRSQTTRFVWEGLLAYLLLATKVLSDSRRDGRRTVALADLKHLISDLDVSKEEKERLARLIDQLETEDESGTSPKED